MPTLSRTREVIELSDQVVMHTYGRLGLAFARGQGSWLWDLEGKKYLDFVSGLAVTGLGHAHPRLVEAISEAARNLIHTSNLFYIPYQAQLAQRLTELTGLDRAFFCNSGAEANEAAIKLARRYQRKVRGNGRYEIITATQSFHGRTLAAVTATGQPKYHDGFDPLPPGFKYVPLNDLQALKDAITENTAAIMLEPIQGEAGVYPCDYTYLRAVRQLCDEQDILLIMDEVQTGVGRTGRFLASHTYDVQPDICTLAKALAGGVPIGCMMATEDVAKGFEPGSHASTFGGNPLACRAALAVLEVLIEDGVLDRVSLAGRRLKAGLQDLALRRSDLVGDVRGKGLMWGIDIKVSGRGVLETCIENGLLINVIADKTVRLLPPLIVTDDEIDEALSILEKALVAHA